MKTRTAISLTSMAIALGTVATAGAQPLVDTAVDRSSIDALQCWRHLSASSVRIGQPFTMTVTCGVVETDTARTVPNERSLEPESIDVAPFEMIDGVRYADLRAGSRRFLQFNYTLRLIGEAYFGSDVELPGLELTYRIERSLGNGSVLPGRELTYVLPPQSVRVLSLVPNGATDIRELPFVTFGQADARLFRANLAMLAAAALGMAALGFLVSAILRVRQEWQGAVPQKRKPIPPAVVTRRVLDELTILQKTTQDEGWSRQFVERALTAFRLACAVALSAPIAQRVVASDVGEREGQLNLRRGFWRQQTTALSAALTPDAITPIRRVGPVDDTNASQVNDLQHALMVFTVARYSQNGDLPTDALTTELDKGIALVRRLRIRSLAAYRLSWLLLQSARNWWRQAWRR